MTFVPFVKIAPSLVGFSAAAYVMYYLVKERWDHPSIGPTITPS